MSDWQKVRVTFNDADGNEVSAVMWQDNFPQGATVDREKDALWIGWNMIAKPKVEPIRELPTGVGAVIRLTTNPYGDDRDLLVLGPLGEWVGQLTTYPADHLHAGNYEILSEGIQIGGVK